MTPFPRQPNKVSGHPSHKVLATRDELHLPNNVITSWPAEQAKRGAQELSKWLSQRCALKIDAVPIIAMPGWYITDDKTGSVRVLNGSGLPKIWPHLGKEDTLSESEVKIVAARIEEHCRNVEGA